MNNLKNILDQENHSIKLDKYEHPTVTIATTLHKPVWGANPYVRFGYVPQTIFEHTWVQLSGSMNNDMINADKQVNNQWRKYDI